MIDPKRVIYLFCLALVIGLVLVYLRTAHVQHISRMVSLASEQKQLEQDLWHQQVEIHGRIGSASQIREQIEQKDVPVVPPGTELPEEPEDD